MQTRRLEVDTDVNGGQEEKDGTQEVRPNIQCLVMEHEERVGGVTVGAEANAISLPHIGVVLDVLLEVRVIDVANIRLHSLLLLLRRWAFFGWGPRRFALWSAFLLSFGQA